MMLQSATPITSYPLPLQSHAGIVSKRRKSWFLHSLVAPRFKFSDARFHADIPRVSPKRGPQTRVGWEN